MNEEIEIYMGKYLEMVDYAANNLLKFYEMKSKRQLLTCHEIHELWSLYGKEINGLCYFGHGLGMCASSDSFFVDWDFDASESRWCGVNPYFLSQTILKNQFENFDKYNADFIKSEFEKAVEMNELYKENEVYYPVIPKRKKFSPAFPAEFDSVIIEQFDKKWMIDNGKLIKKFVRKSTTVNQCVYKNPFRYTLKFVQGDNVVYEIPYTDTDYPVNAVQIMTNQIMNRLWKGSEN